jgi:hypothetical protein
MAQGTQPNGAYQWLHAKPLDAAIGRVLAPYQPGGRHGHCRCRCVQNTNKTQLLASDYCTFLLAELSILVTQKGTLYSRHRCNKLRNNVRCHDSKESH